MRARTVWTDEMVERLRTMALDGMRQEDVATAFRLPLSIIVSASRRYGTKFLGNRRRGATDADREAVLQAAREGISIRQLKERTGRGREFLNRLARDMGVKFCQHPKGRQRTANPRVVSKKAGDRRPLRVNIETLAPLQCEPVSLLDLEPCHCRWPVSGESAETLFCGARKVSGESYCEAHVAFAYANTPAVKKAA